MKLDSAPKSRGFTLVELVVSIVVGIVVVWLVVSSAQRQQKAHDRIMCLNNLKQVGTAYQIWNKEHNGQYPASESITLGGWKETLTNSSVGPVCWTNYALMSNELGNEPKVLVCPGDERNPADSFADIRSNTNLSYFVGVSASDAHPESLVGGDRNLGSGLRPGDDYGFSPTNGAGNDVAVATNSNINPVCWSLKMHTKGNWAGAANILLGDGSAEQVTSRLFRDHYLSRVGLTTEWPTGHVPSTPSIRLLFP